MTCQRSWAKANRLRGFGRIIRDQFDQLYKVRSSGVAEDNVDIAASAGVRLYPFLMKHIEEALAYIAGHSDVWLATGGEINSWYRAAGSGDRRQGHSVRRT